LTPKTPWCAAVWLHPWYVNLTVGELLAEDLGSSIAQELARVNTISHATASASALRAYLAPRHFVWNPNMQNRWSSSSPVGMLTGCI